MRVEIGAGTWLGLAISGGPRAHSTCEVSDTSSTPTCSFLHEIMGAATLASDLQAAARGYCPPPALGQQLLSSTRGLGFSVMSKMLLFLETRGFNLRQRRENSRCVRLMITMGVTSSERTPLSIMARDDPLHL